MRIRSRRACRACIVLFLKFAFLSGNAWAHAQPGDATDTIEVHAEESDDVEAITVLGSRREPRTSLDSSVPVDVFRDHALQAQGSTDIINTLISVVPSLNASREPINDAATLVRPVSLRGLPSDHTLVLVNGKRRHRGAVVGEVVSGVNRGAQGVDIYPLFGFGLDQVEVLRDGAAAQYGSDAIAGVVNYSLISDPFARGVSLQLGQTYEGDGRAIDVSGVFGIPIGDEHGFATLAFQVRDQGTTSRGVQDGGAAELSAAGFPMADPVVTWGQPNIRDDYKFLWNSGYRLGDAANLYVFGSFARRAVDTSFFYRNPTNRPGVFSDGPNVLFADLTGEGNCPVGPLPIDSFISANAFIQGAPSNCFSFLNRFPGGFTPRFGGIVQDTSVFAGTRGTMWEVFDYDISLGFGENRVGYEISNTINPSLGPESPTSFDLGAQIQSEMVMNADFSYPLEVGFISPINVAFGFQALVEEFEITQGEVDSYRVGPFAAQGFSVGANGFPGFSDTVAGGFGREAYSLYLDIETDVTNWLLLSGAVRFEDYSDFGWTWNGKASALLSLSRAIHFRGSVSTGFRAPTLGQSHLQRSTLASQDGELVESLILSSTNPIAEFFGGGQLVPETTLNFSFGAMVRLAGLELTADYFNIRVTDRLGMTTFRLSPDDQNQLFAQGIPNATQLSQVQFFVNDFDTRTQGVDIVVNYPFSWILGHTTLGAAFNWTDTTVIDRGETITDGIAREIEDGLPDIRVTGNLIHSVGPVDALIRINYYGEVYESLFTDETLPVVTPGLAVVDVEMGWQTFEHFRLAVGAKNLFDTRPAEWRIPDGQGGFLTGATGGFLGTVYPLHHPAGFNGGTYYARLTAGF